MEKSSCSLVLVLKIAATCSLLLLTLSQDCRAESASRIKQRRYDGITSRRRRQKVVNNRAAQCFDTLVGWSDIGGTKYNCEWYANDGHCDDYGDFFKNYGVTAKDVCCTCGGGGPSFAPLPPSPEHAPSPTTKPAVFVIPILGDPFQPSPSKAYYNEPSSSSSQSKSYPCVDSIDGWYDVGGSGYNCEWYAEGSNCDDYGAFFARGGKTAKEVCCACGGGVEDDDNTNINNPTLSPSSGSGSPTSGIISGAINNGGSDGQLINSNGPMTFVYLAIGGLVTVLVWYLTRNDSFK